jgi:hypothetical protein
MDEGGYPAGNAANLPRNSYIRYNALVTCQVSLSLSENGAFSNVLHKSIYAGKEKCKEIIFS